MEIFLIITMLIVLWDLNGIKNALEAIHMPASSNISFTTIESSLSEIAFNTDKLRTNKLDDIEQKLEKTVDALEAIVANTGDIVTNTDRDV